MDTSVVAALAGTFGSLAGAAGYIATTWITQHRESMRDNMKWQLRERESLYREFIAQASRLAVDAAASSLERPEQLIALYGILGPLRLVASDEVLAQAEKCCRQIVDLYRQPNLTAEQIRDAFETQRLDPLKDFSETSRRELFAMTGVIN